MPPPPPPSRCRCRCYCRPPPSPPRRRTSVPPSARRRTGCTRYRRTIPASSIRTAGRAATGHSRCCCTFVPWPRPKLCRQTLLDQEATEEGGPCRACFPALLLVSSSMLGFLLQLGPLFVIEFWPFLPDATPLSDGPPPYLHDATAGQTCATASER